MLYTTDSTVLQGPSCSAQPLQWSSDDSALLNELLDDSASMLAEIATLRQQIPALQARVHQEKRDIDELEVRVEQLQRQRDLKAKASRAAALDSMKFF